MPENTESGAAQTVYRCEACGSFMLGNPALHELQYHAGAQTCWPTSEFDVQHDG